jgi:Chalcone isomerase-like
MKAFFTLIEPGALRVLVASALSWSASVQAHECRGVTSPDQLRADAADLSLDGLGIRKATFLKVNVYVAALYVTVPTHDANALIASSES